jgi:hypothetical protein
VSLTSQGEAFSEARSFHRSLHRSLPAQIPHSDGSWKADDRRKRALLETYRGSNQADVNPDMIRVDCRFKNDDFDVFLSRLCLTQPLLALFMIPAFDFAFH